MIKVITSVVHHFKWKGIIGCGFPAAIQNGIVLTASNIDKSWIGVDANELISNATNCKTFVANDADVAGIAEIKFGAGKNQTGVVLLLTIGTGIGSVIFNNGVLLPNTELGHIELNGKDAEKYASDATRKKEELSWTQWGKRFNEYLKYMENYFYPELIILGGGASKKFNEYSRQIKIKTKVVPATLENHAGIVGAALYGYSKK